MTLRVLIADDELMARRRLRRLLEAIDDVEIVSECDSGEAALSALASQSVDVAVLDVRMPGLSGLDVSSAALDLGVEIVLATAHSEHAVAAFERGVADYVMKPVDGERLAAAIERVRARVGAREASSEPIAPAAARLPITVKGEVRLVDPASVVYARVEGALVEIAAGDEKLLTDTSLAELERRLGGHVLRVHRRALLSLAHVDRLRPLATGGYLAITKGGDEVPVSRQEARRLRARLGI